MSKQRKTWVNSGCPTWKLCQLATFWEKLPSSLEMGLTTNEVNVDEMADQKQNENVMKEMPYLASNLTVFLPYTMTQWFKITKNVSLNKQFDSILMTISTSKDKWSSSIIIFVHCIESMKFIHYNLCPLNQWSSSIIIFVHWINEVHP